MWIQSFGVQYQNKSRILLNLEASFSVSDILYLSLIIDRNVADQHLALSGTQSPTSKVTEFITKCDEYIRNIVK